MMDRKSFSKKISLYGGQVELWFVPWITLDQNDKLAQLASHMGLDHTEELPANAWAFCFADCGISAIDVVDNPTKSEAKAFKAYADNRNGSITNNYDFASQAFSVDMVQAYQDARLEALDNPSPASDELTTLPSEPTPGEIEADPKATNVTEKPVESVTKKS